MIQTLHEDQSEIAKSRFPWFALQVRSRHELNVADQLQAKGYDPFVPTYQSNRRWSDRAKVVHAPLFPGYLFCRLDLQSRLPILMTPGVTRIVGLGKVPTPVNEAEMASMQTAVGSGLLSQPWPFLQAGDRVHIERGPLRGLEGILLEVRGEQRLVLSVTLLQRSVAVVIDPTFVRSLSETSFIPVRRPDSHSYNSSASSKKAIGILG